MRTLSLLWRSFLVSICFMVFWGVLGTTSTTQACASDMDCQSGEICRNRICMKPECQKDDDCKQEKVCRRDVCLPACKSDSDCSQTSSCENGACQLGQMCFQPDWKCPENWECHKESLQCRRKTSICKEDRDCKPGYRCINGDCILSKEEYLESPSNNERVIIDTNPDASSSDSITIDKALCGCSGVGESSFLFLGVFFFLFFFQRKGLS